MVLSEFAIPLLTSICMYGSVCFIISHCIKIRETNYEKNRKYLGSSLGNSGQSTSTPNPVKAEIYRPEYQNQAPTQPQTNVPVSAAQADPGLWNESMYSPMFAEGGIASYGLGGDVNSSYPQAYQDMTQFANQNQLPTAARNVQYEPNTNPMTGQMIGYADGGVASYAFGDLVEREEKEVRPKLSNPLLEYYSKHTKAKVSQ